MTTSETELHAFGAQLQEVAAALTGAVAAIIERLQPALTALARALTEILGPYFAALGPGRRPGRTTKAERRAAKRHLAARRIAAPGAAPIGVAAWARARRAPATGLGHQGAQA